MLVISVGSIGWGLLAVVGIAGAAWWFGPKASRYINNKRPGG